MRIALLPGSLRAGSYNRKLLLVAEQVLQKYGVETYPIDLMTLALPPYDGDIEEAEGLPDSVFVLKSKVTEAHAVIIACPEYSGGIPGAFKNALDWSTRGGSNPWTGKVVMLMGASAGPWGTNRMQPSLRAVLAVMGALVIPQSVTIPNAEQVWDEAGRVLDDVLPHRVEKVIARLLEVASKMTGEQTI